MAEELTVNKENPIEEDRIVREPERAHLTGVHRTQWYVLETAGLVPQRIAIGEITHGWMLSEIRAWIAERRKDRKGFAKLAAKAKPPRTAPAPIPRSRLAKRAAAEAAATTNANANASKRRTGASA